MLGIDDLVEKVVGPRGFLTRIKVFKNVQDAIEKGLKLIEKIGQKYYQWDNVKDFMNRLVQTIQTQKIEQMVDQVLQLLQKVDTNKLQQLFDQLQTSDRDEWMTMFQKYLPKSEQLMKVVEKLKRIRLQDLSEETLVQILVSSGKL